jgi:hypothetical protein
MELFCPNRPGGRHRVRSLCGRLQGRRGEGIMHVAVECLPQGPGAPPPRAVAAQLGSWLPLHTCESPRATEDG